MPMVARQAVSRSRTAASAQGRPGTGIGMTWGVLIRNHHEGYISWAEYVRNQELMAENANGKSYLARGSPRKGEALLPGLFRCARCGRRLQVAYSGSDRATQRYVCTGAFSQLAAASCIAFGGMRVDRAVAAEV